MKLDFVCIGAQKAGTTTLHDILNSHPEIYLPTNKEALFFDINERYEKGLGWFYQTFFETYNQEKSIGNINPNLQLQNRSLERLHALFGNELKVVFILRDPVKRAYSHYLMSKRRGYEKLSFIGALQAEKERLISPVIRNNYVTKELGHYEMNHFGYCFRSRYFDTIKYLFETFPRENIHLILFEELFKNKRAKIEELLEFLSLPYSDQMNLEVQSNAAAEPRNEKLRDLVFQPNLLRSFFANILTEKQKAYFKTRLININNKPLDVNDKKLETDERLKIFEKYFSEDVAKIENLTGLDLKNWRK